MDMEKKGRQWPSQKSGCATPGSNHKEASLQPDGKKGGMKMGGGMSKKGDGPGMKNYM